MFIKIEIPITASSLEDCTITTLNKTTTAKEILNKISEIELEIENHEQRITELETNPTETHTHENKEVLDNITQEQLDQIEINKTNIQSHETRITELETNGVGGGETHEHPNLAILNKIRQKDLDQIKHNVDNIVKLKIDLSKEILFRNVMQDATWEYEYKSFKPLTEFIDLFIDTLEGWSYTTDFSKFDGCNYNENYKAITSNKYVNLYSQEFPNLYEEKWKLFQDAPLNGGKVYAVTQSKKFMKLIWIR